MMLPERPDAKSLDRALGHMEKLGIKANVASPADTEIMYLTKQAYVTQAGKSPEYV